MVRSGKIPRVVIAATASGAGKTTATVALIGAMRARGLKVAAFKCGLTITFSSRRLFPFSIDNAEIWWQLIFRLWLLLKLD